jgi:hypothetical protein
MTTDSHLGALITKDNNPTDSFTFSYSGKGLGQFFGREPRAEDLQNVLALVGGNAPAGITICRLEAILTEGQIGHDYSISSLDELRGLVRTSNDSRHFEVRPVTPASDMVYFFLNDLPCDGRIYASEQNLANKILSGSEFVAGVAAISLAMVLKHTDPAFMTIASGTGGIFTLLDGLRRVGNSYCQSLSLDFRFTGSPEGVDMMMYNEFISNLKHG